mmetsp:Transcript_4794/g.8561  ORF Transcript_4794/g.8561 Transcript_4794/m.8561 type:complete len:232 (-) Transcript_4794:455-1150(-)
MHPTLLSCITNTTWAYGKRRICFREGRRVVHSANTVLSTSFSESQTSSGCMSNNVSTDGLCRVLGKGHCTRIGNNLVGHEHCHAKLFGKTSQLPQELSKLHLSLGQLSTALVIGTIQCRGRIDDNQSVTILGHDGCGHFEELGLMFTVVGAGVGHVLECNGGVHSKSLGNGLETLWAEGTFCINVDGLSFGPTISNGHLASNTKSMAKLCLARTKLSKHLRKRSRLNPSLQ